jgi:hypothetical protein
MERFVNSVPPLSNPPLGILSLQYLNIESLASQLETIALRRSTKIRAGSFVPFMPICPSYTNELRNEGKASKMLTIKKGC